MSSEIWKLLEKMNQETIQAQMALQCGPLFFGLKVANLLILNENHTEQIQEILEGSVIRHRLFLEVEGMTVSLLYDPYALSKYLMEPQVQEIFRMLDYQSFQMEELMDEFLIRYQAYYNDVDLFPHEIGLFLGYPAFDVKAFMEYKGKYSLHTGEWKVYGNLSEAVQLFEKYNKAKEYMIHMLSKGIGINAMLKANANGRYRQSIYI